MGEFHAKLGQAGAEEDTHLARGLAFALAWLTTFAPGAASGPTYTIRAVVAMIREYAFVVGEVVPEVCPWAVYRAIEQLGIPHEDGTTTTLGVWLSDPLDRRIVEGLEVGMLVESKRGAPSPP